MVSADEYIYNDKKYNIEIVRKNNKNTYLRVRDNTEINNDKIYTKDEKAFNKYFTKYIRNIYSERLDYWYNIFEENIPYPNLKIRKMTSRWGVCNIKNHNVTLNLELSKYDISALDYVIVHELSHFIHHNHSKDFWLLVGKYYPNYKDIRKMLRN